MRLIIAKTKSKPKPATATATGEVVEVLPAPARINKSWSKAPGDPDWTENKVIVTRPS